MGRTRKRAAPRQQPLPASTPPSPDASNGELNAELNAEFNNEPAPQPALPFPVVCVGASAGGLEAFSQLLGALPTDTGMAFVLVSHLSPSHTSHLAEILSRATQLPVNEVKDKPKVLPNSFNVIPLDLNVS